MKSVIFLLFTILIQSRHSQCDDFFYKMTVKINEMGKAVTNTFGGWYNKMKAAFGSPIATVKQSYYTVEQYILEEKVKQAFDDFLEKHSYSSEKESSEYLNMSLEPSALMSTPKLAHLHGRQIESHFTTTKDGYILTLHRLLQAFSQNDTKCSNGTIILHHGLLGSSADWILLGAEKSLPYILSDAGYDVWMANARGNYYSRGHVTKRIDSPEFWKFTFQEIGEYDLPAVIDYVREVKNSTKPINFIGHSMGASALLVMLSSVPSYNKYLRIGILLAPLVFMSHVQGPLRILTTMSMNPPAQLLKALGDTEFLPSRRIPKLLATKFCRGPKIYCSNPLLFLAGLQPLNYAENPSFVARLLYHIPAGGSTDTIMHYGQLISSEKFHRFNRESSEFPLHQVTLPIAMISSGGDWLATIPDILRLYFSISNPVDHHVVRIRNLSHTEFVWGEDANALVFPKIMDYLENGLNINFTKQNEI